MTLDVRGAQVGGPVGSRPAAEQVWAVVPSPVGDLVLTGSDDVLSGCWFTGVERRRDPWAQLRRDDAAFPEARRQLDEYFAGSRQAFDLVLAPVGTPFQLEVWAALREIPYGGTWSYKQLADRVGRPSASRAVGLANGRNPISVIVPCHRVIGASGQLTGYGGGLARKRWLLDLEAGALPFA
jgi:methylated-DNA-[protein]-cysteine S-methyltransferase